MNGAASVVLLISFLVWSMVICFMKKSFFYSIDRNSRPPAFVQYAGDNSYWQMGQNRYSLEDGRGTYEFFICRCAGICGVLQSLWTLLQYLDHPNAKTMVLIICYPVAMILVFMYHTTMQIKLLQMFNQKSV